MGYWEETCAITSLPIDSGEEVVAVVLSEDFEKTITHPFGCVIPDFSVVESIHRGIYNWFGGLEDDEFEGKQSIIFFKQEAWDSIIYDCPETDIFPRIGAYVEQIMRFYGGPLGVELFDDAVNRLDEFAAVVCFCMYIRRDVVSTVCYRGWQDSRQTSSYYRRWAELIADAASEKEKEEQK